MTRSLNRANIFLYIYMLSFVNCQCPTMQSGRCFVDCTNSSVYNIACEDIKGLDLYQDLWVYKNSSQPIHLAVWNSALTRLGAVILEPVNNQLIRLELDNVEKLEHFPELQELKFLTELVLMNCPRLTEMPLELLPPGIKRLSLYRTGITYFFYDSEETRSLPSLFEFTLVSGRIDDIHPEYFRAFPMLKKLQIVDSEFGVTAEPPTFYTPRPLTHVRIINNKVPSGKEAIVYESILNSLHLDTSAVVDLSDNGFSMRSAASIYSTKVRLTKHLSLARNQFQEFASTASVFLDFKQLETLDLSSTNFFKVAGALAGLPSLKTLHISGNRLEDLTVVNIFRGSAFRNLTLLDLSDNNLQYLPAGMEIFANSLEELILRDNRLNLRSIYYDPIDSYISNFDQFPNLRNLDLSYNTLTSFSGSYLNNLKALYSLNIACNSFRHIERKFFELLPVKLRILNMTFCLPNTETGITFANDAFTLLPPIKILILQQGMLRSSFFDATKSAKMERLSELDLGFNALAVLRADHFTSLWKLRTLKMNNNRLQSLGSRVFSRLRNLVELDVSWNHMHSVGVDAFADLCNLQTLTLTGNSITELASETFDPLINLENLYLAYNNISDFVRLFQNAGGKLIHLGIQNNPVDCLSNQLFGRLRKLKWLYLNSSRAVTLDFGSFQNLVGTLTRHPFRLWAFKKPVLSDIGCESWEDWATAYTRSSRFVIKDTTNAVVQHMLINFPSCHMENPRKIKRYIDNLVC